MEYNLKKEYGFSARYFLLVFGLFLCGFVGFFPIFALASPELGVRVLSQSAPSTFSNGMATSSSFTVLSGCSYGARLFVTQYHDSDTNPSYYMTSFSVDATSTLAIDFTGTTASGAKATAYIDGVTSGSHTARFLGPQGYLSGTIDIHQFCSPAPVSSGGGGGSEIPNPLPVNVVTSAASLTSIDGVSFYDWLIMNGWIVFMLTPLWLSFLFHNFYPQRRGKVKI